MIRVTRDAGWPTDFTTVSSLLSSVGSNSTVIRNPRLAWKLQINAPVFGAQMADELGLLRRTPKLCRPSLSQDSMMQSIDVLLYFRTVLLKAVSGGPKAAVYNDAGSAVYT